jgi:competence protein ComEA
MRLSVVFWVRQLIGHLVKTGTWFGWGRIVTACVCIPMVGFGAFFLLRTPAMPVEASMTYASSVPVSSSVLSGVAGSQTPVSASLSVPDIAVHVAGNVLKPGVYDLPGDARVVDAIRLAGGATAIADLNAINLANPLNDGQQVYVPAVGEKVPPSSNGLSAGGDGTGSATNSVEYPININSADAALLDELPGVGPATAQAIVTYRDQNGPFVNVNGLEDVPGIGPAKVAALQGLATT